MANPEKPVEETVQKQVSDITLPVTQKQTKHASFFNIAVSSMIIFPAITPSLLTIRALFSFPTTLACAVSWVYLFKGINPSLKEIGQLGVEIIRSTAVGIVILGAALGVCIGVVTTVRIWARKSQSIIPSQKSKTRRWRVKTTMQRLAIVTICGVVAAAELSIGIAALRYWYEKSIDGVTENPVPFIACAVFGGVVPGLLSAVRKAVKGTGEESETSDPSAEGEGSIRLEETSDCNV